MKRRKFVAPGILGVLVLMGGASLLSREPRYEGRTLRQWVLATYQDTNDAAAALGLKTIAVRAVPYYARILERKDSSLNRFSRGIWLRLPAFFQDAFTEPLPAQTARIDAELLLKSAGPLARPAMPELLRCAQDPNEAVRQTAIEALAEIGQAEVMVPVLVAACRDPFFGVRRSAVEGLGRYGPTARPALAVLIETLEDRDQRVRACAAGALWAVDRQTNVAMRVLAETLHDQMPTVRALSAMYLGQLGPVAQPLVPDLVKALNDFPDVAFQARLALGRIAPTPATGANRQ